MVAWTRQQVLGFRMRAQQLARSTGTVEDTAVLDLGVQDTGPDGARWALALRGLVEPDPAALALAWTIRGAPHVYRRADLPGVAAATAPFSEADAGKRIFDAATPLKQAGIPIIDALDTVAGRMREIVTAPMVKGEMSGRLTAALDEPYLRFCRPCDAIHAWEQPFRLAALRAGLELQPGTSPPVLQPIPGFAPTDAVPDRLDVVRGCLRLLGLTTPALVAGYLDARVADVRARWPADAVELDVEGERRWLLPDDVDPADPPEGTWLLGPFDLLLQARDRTLLVPDPAKAKALWPVLGRPGAVLHDGEIVGLWRPKKSGATLAVTAEPWVPVRPALRTVVQAQAERLAAVRGVRLSRVLLGG